MHIADVLFVRMGRRQLKNINNIEKTKKESSESVTQLSTLLH